MGEYGADGGKRLMGKGKFHKCRGDFWMYSSSLGLQTVASGSVGRAWQISWLIAIPAVNP